MNGEAELKKEWGVSEAHAKGTLFAGGEASASGTIGAHGFGAHANVFAGGKVEGEVAADVAGIGVGANGTLQYGLGAQLDAQAVYDAGHIKVDFKAGALRLRRRRRREDRHRPAELGHTISEYGGAAVDTSATRARRGRRRRLRLGRRRFVRGAAMTLPLDFVVPDGWTAVTRAAPARCSSPCTTRPGESSRTSR